MSLRRWILILLLLGTLSGCGGPYSSGDRVLVSKMAYDAGLTEPKRYEVVVFKYPGKLENGHVRGGPLDKNTPKNYIKRLLGLPGELLAIFFGRLYHRVPEPGAGPFFDDVNENTPKGELWYNIHMHTVDPDTRKNVHDIHATEIDKKGDLMAKWFEEGKFNILRKPPHIIMALRRIVYDNDYQARDMKGKHDRWAPAKTSNWKNDKGTGFTHDGKSDTVDWLTYQHLLRKRIDPFREQDRVDPKGEINPSLILDSLDYNSVQIAQPRDKGAEISPYWVGDLMIECNVEVIEPKGEFWFELSKGMYRFRAKWDLATGQCTLYRQDTVVDKKVEELASQPTSVKGPGNYVLRFANIDARLTVWVDRALPFGDGQEYTPPEMLTKGETSWTAETALARRGPRKENDLERPASVGSKGAHVNISHLRLWRDTYYSTSVSKSDYGMGWDGWQQPERWDAIRKARYATLYVQPEHFLCLGDNSQASSDSRDWGLVPERLMLGRALVVYYPLDRMGAIR